MCKFVYFYIETLAGKKEVGSQSVSLKKCQPANHQAMRKHFGYEGVRDRGCCVHRGWSSRSTIRTQRHQWHAGQCPCQLHPELHHVQLCLAALTGSPPLRW